MENKKGIVKLTRKQLYDEILALSVAGVARKYNLNYGKLIATCKVENISFPSSGYWTKKNMGKDVSNEIVEFSGLEDTEISLITKDAAVKRIQKAKAEVVEKVHTDVTEELDVVTEEDLPQKKTDNIPEWPDGILDYLDETERNKVLEYAYAYEDLEIHKGTAEEINHYIERKLSEHSFSWYFAKKFTDFAGLHMAFFATVLLSFLFIQDTRKSTYELLHTKPVTAIQYICGKVISGFISMLGVLVILNVIFFMLCLKTSLESGFPVTPIDFCVNSLIYIVPNLLMICCVYTITAVIFKNPLPAAPILFLHIIYSNMLTMKNDIYYMRPFSIMVRFPGRFFETHVAKMSNINQIILVISSVILVCISVTIWKRRRVH